MLPVMLTHFVMIVCGIDPLAHLDSPGAAEGVQRGSDVT